MSRRWTRRARNTSQQGRGERGEGRGERGEAQAQKLAYEIDYLSRWMPETVDEEETRNLVRSAIAEVGADDMKSMGRVMGHVMKSGAEVDGALVSRIAREELS